MNKRQFLIEWANAEDDLTTYDLNPFVCKWDDIYYPNSGQKGEIKARKNLYYHLTRLVNEGLLQTPTCVGLGEGSKMEFFGITKQWFWRVNKHILSQILENERKVHLIHESK